MKTEVGSSTILKVVDDRCVLYCNCGGTAEVDVKRLVKEGRVVVRCNKRGHELVVDFLNIPQGMVRVRMERLELE
ncbi:MAG: hypothetical protein ACO2O4_04630 [Minisyncoccia bacterium]|jgi:hypothetical protein